MLARLRGSLRGPIAFRQSYVTGGGDTDEDTHRSPRSRLTSSSVHPSGLRTLAMAQSELGRRSVMERTGGDVTNAHAALAWPQSGAYTLRRQSGWVGRRVCSTAVGSSSAPGEKWR